MWTATRRQNLDRVNIFRPIKPSVFHTDEAHPWCVWLPIGVTGELVGEAYAFPSHAAATEFVRRIAELQSYRHDRSLRKRCLNFYGGVTC